MVGAEDGSVEEEESVAYVSGASGWRKCWVNNVNALKIDRWLLETDLSVNGRREIDFGVSRSWPGVRSSQP